MNSSEHRLHHDANAIARLERVIHETRLLHVALAPLWDELVEADGLRTLAVRGFANIVRQHATETGVRVYFSRFARNAERIRFTSNRAQGKLGSESKQGAESTFS